MTATKARLSLAKTACISFVQTVLSKYKYLVYEKSHARNPKTILSCLEALTKSHGYMYLSTAKFNSEKSYNKISDALKLHNL